MLKIYGLYAEVARDILRGLALSGLCLYACVYGNGISDKNLDLMLANDSTCDTTETHPSVGNLIAGYPSHSMMISVLQTKAPHAAYIMQGQGYTFSKISGLEEL